MLTNIIAAMKAEQAHGAANAADFADRLALHIESLEEHARAIQDLHADACRLITDTRTLRAWALEEAKERVTAVDAIIGPEPQQPAPAEAQAMKPVVEDDEATQVAAQ